jgi:hypothetical protein
MDIIREEAAHDELGSNKQLVAIPPEGCSEYFTPGKEYPVIHHRKSATQEIFGYAFRVYADTGDLALCLQHQCGHLNDQSWIIKEKE